MKILVVGGTYDNKNGKPSGLINKLFSVINGDKKLYNGGNYETLKEVITTVAKYDVVFWMANVDNSLPKIRNIKDIASNITLITSKRNDGDKYTINELIQRANALKSDIFFEFKKQDSGLFQIQVFDKDGNILYSGFDIQKSVQATIKNI